MGNCSSCGSGAGPMAEGRELVEFVCNAHGGALRERPIPGGGLLTRCGGCEKEFRLTTFVGLCPHCEGVHAVSPPRANDGANVQYAGRDFRLS